MPLSFVPRGRRAGVLAFCLFLVTGAVLCGADGSLKFAFATGSFSQHPVILSSPAIDADGMVFTGFLYDLDEDSSGGVVAIAPNILETPQKKHAWLVSTDHPVEGSPLIHENLVYFADFDGTLYAVDRRTGAERSRVDLSAELASTDVSVASSPVLSRDGATLYLSFALWRSEIGGVIAFSRENLQVRWISFLPGYVQAAPVVGTDGRLYIGSVNNTLYALGPNDGGILWQRALEGSIWTEAALGPDGTIYVGTTNIIAAVSPDNVLRWTRPLQVWGSPVVGPAGTIYVGNNADWHLYALNPGEGDTKWKSPGQPAPGSTPAIRADGIVLFGGNDGRLRAYDAATGEVKWTSDLAAPAATLASSPAISPGPDRRIVVGTTSGHVLAFEGNGFGLSPNASWPMLQRDPAHTGRAQTTPVRGGRLINLATRGVTGPNFNFIGGYVLGGVGAKSILMRAVGPTLQEWLTTPQPDPKLTLYRQTSPQPTQLATNDNWEENAERARILTLSSSVGAFPLRPQSKDAVLLNAAQANQAYTGIVESASGAIGVSLFEVWDTDYQQTHASLLNLSTRGFAGTGENTLIPSLVIGGEGRLRVLLRAVGPSLMKWGVTDVLQRPVIQVYSGNALIASASNWWARPDRGDIAAIAELVGAQSLDAGSRDAAIILTLEPGAYTFQVSGEGGTTGNALVEVYAIPF